IIYMKKNIFENNIKDLTTPTHYTIKSSLVKMIKNDAKKYNISESRVVNLILEEYYSKNNI
ncbi:MAG: hypothetical protein K2I36_03260, partial [Ureaplasma sp.]|nr:hypothetical protein [Ureaplasma sp.]